MTSREKYLSMADNNLVYSIKNRMNHIKDSVLYEEDEYIIFSIGVDGIDGHLNAGICLDDSKAEEFLLKIDEIFKELNRSYAVWVRDHDNKRLEKILREKGLTPIREPGTRCMICSNKIEGVKPPEGFTLKIIENESQVEDLKSVIKEAFDKDDKVSNVLFNLEMICNPNAKGIIVYEDKSGKPVAGATTVISEGVAGIYYVGTLEEYRGKGLGALITKESTNIGFDSGAEYVILQASELGERVYSKIGYEGISYYRSYRVEF